MKSKATHQKLAGFIPGGHVGVVAAGGTQERGNPAQIFQGLLDLGMLPVPDQPDQRVAEVPPRCQTPLQWRSDQHTWQSL